MKRFPCLVVSVSTAVFALLAGCSTPTALPADFAPQDAAAPDAVVAFDATPLSDVLRLPPVDAASSCAPAALMSFMPTYERPTGPYKDACTTEQLENLVAECFGPTAATAGCNAWLASSKNTSCLECWAGPAEGVTTWAPVVYSMNGGQQIYVNVGGCVALAAPSEVTCAVETEYELECEMAACVPACPIPKTGDATTASHALGQCLEAADQGVCSKYATQLTACAEMLSADGAAGGAAAFCYSAATSATALRQYLELACGPPPSEPEGGAVPPPTPDAGAHPDAAKTGDGSMPH